jgi:hypothetical protein
VSAAILERVETGQITSSDGSRELNQAIIDMGLSTSTLSTMIIQLESRIARLERERKERLREMREFEERLSLLEQIIEDQKREIRMLRGQYDYEVSGAIMYTSTPGLWGQNPVGFHGTMYVRTRDRFGLQAGVDYYPELSIAGDVDYQWREFTLHVALARDLLPRDMPLSIRAAVGVGLASSSLIGPRETVLPGIEQASADAIGTFVGLGRVDIAAGPPDWALVPFAGVSFKTNRNTVTNGEVTRAGSGLLEGTFGLRLRIIKSEESNEPRFPFN